MNHNIEEIRVLMMEKLDRSIDPDSDRLLQQLINERPDVHALWRELQEYFGTGAGNAALRRLDLNAEWSILQAKTIAPKRRPLYFYLRIASCAAAVIVGAILFNHLNRMDVKPNDPMVAGSSALMPRKITLTLDDGQTFNLSDNKSRSINAGNARLNNTGQSLSYTAGNTSQWSTVTVPAAMDYKIMLSDSSILWLNSATTARFPLTFSRERREIEVNGEAYLQVAKHAGQPFIVHLPGTDVEVLGTEFNLNTYDAGTARVALVQGKVNIKADGKTVQLSPGFEAIAESGTDVQVNTFSSREKLSWMKGQFVFSNARLSEIAKVLRRWYGIEVTITHPEAANKRFTGVIDKHKKLADFLDNLSSTAEVNYSFEGERLLFK